MTERKKDGQNQVAVGCTPERRKRVYAAAAARLQRIAFEHPHLRHDADTPEINCAIEGIDEALMLFIEGRCERERVSAAFDRYEQGLIEASLILEKA